MTTQPATAPGIPTRPTRPSPTQRQVLQHVADGHDAAEIAARMGLSIYTVKEHIKVATARLRARNTAQAVLVALRQGVIR